MSQHLKTIAPGHRLASLIKACEKQCLAECCGIDAFDFSPLHVASHLSAFTGTIRASDVETLQSELASLVESAVSQEADSTGIVCSVGGTNQCFTVEEIQRLAAEISVGLELAPRVLEFANELRRRGV